MKNKRLTTVLLFLLIVVWGAVAYQVLGSVNGDADHSCMADSVLPPQQEAARFVYRPDIRDPFRRTERSAVKSGKAANVQPVVGWSPPPVRLNGILARKGKKTAVFEGTEGQVAFLGAGDTLCGMKVLKIGERSVLYKYMKRKKEWILE